MNKSSAGQQLILIYLSSGILPILYILSFYFLTNSCAQQQPLSGGPRDTIPPKLIKELSTQNFQTNFKKQTIELAFDEYIEIKDVLKQVVISPPLTYISTVERKKGFKTAQFKFDKKETLKEDITYAISFGEAIRDLTESNTVEDLKFLFSTGDYIDSLKMTGQIADALTGDPVPDVLFMLYENFADTVVRTEKPYYFGKTDKTGKFTINYLKAGKYKGFALEDQDLNYLFNIPKERIGFTLDTIIIPETDSIIADVKIRLFEENTILEKPKVDVNTYGLVKMIFRRSPFDVTIRYDSVGQAIYRESEGDTLRYWYHQPDSLDWNFYVQRDTIVDTFTVKRLSPSIAPIRLATQSKVDETLSINPFKKCAITFGYPLKRIDTTFFNFWEITEIPNDTIVAVDTLVLTDDIDSLASNTDTLSTFLISKKKIFGGSFDIDSLDKKTILLDYEWQETFQYQIEILPGGLIDWYNRPNQDTFLLTYKVQARNDFGNINLTITEMDSTQNYWFQLLLGDREIANFSAQQNTSLKRSFNALPPGKYSLKVIEDLNGNKRWDSGNYDKKLQPEKISIASIEELRASWDVEVEVKIDFEE